MVPRTVTIKHPHLKEVHNVVYKKIILPDEVVGSNSSNNMFVEGWMSTENGCLYLKHKGWEEVPLKQDVTGAVKIGRDKDGKTSFILGNEYADRDANCTFTKAKAVVLPDGMNWEEWANKYYHSNSLSIADVLAGKATEVIQVWEEVE